MSAQDLAPALWRSYWMNQLSPRLSENGYTTIQPVIEAARWNILSFHEREPWIRLAQTAIDTINGDLAQR